MVTLKQMKRDGTAFYWKLLDVRQSEKSDLTVLVCKCCDKELMPSNVPRAAGDHFDAGTQTCKAASKKRRKLDDALAGANAAGTSTSGSSMGAGGSMEERRMGRMGASGSGAAPTPRGSATPRGFCSNQQQKDCNLMLARFFFKNNVAERLVGDPDLKGALALFGVVPPSRKVLGGFMLDNEYVLVKVRTGACHHACLPACLPAVLPHACPPASNAAPRT